MDGIVLTVGCNEAAEAATPTAEACKSGLDTYTYCYDAEYDERYRHGERCLMRSMMCMELLVLCTPEYAVIQTEHVECRHGSDASHNPTYHWAVFEAGSDNLIL